MGWRTTVGLLPGRHLQADGRVTLRRFQATEKPLQRRIAAREALLLDQQLPDRLALDALLAPAQDLIARNGSTSDCSCGGRAVAAGCSCSFKQQLTPEGRVRWHGNWVIELGRASRAGMGTGPRIGRELLLVPSAVGNP